MRYKIFGNSDVAGHQEYTYINTDNISPPQLYTAVTEILYERFKDYDVKINHAGRTVTINYKEIEQ